MLKASFHWPDLGEKLTKDSYKWNKPISNDNYNRIKQWSLHCSRFDPREKLKEKNVKLHSYKFYMTELYLRHEIWVISGGIFHAFVELKSSITICGTRTLYTAF